MMKYNNVYTLLLMVILLTSCKRQDKGVVLKDESASKRVTASYSPDNANEKYIIDKKESVVMWKGSMVLADKGAHTGYINISRGELIIEKSQLVGGTVDVDMNTIADALRGVRKSEQ